MGTKLVVDPTVYSLAGASLHSYATEFRKIFASQIQALSGSASMGGNCGESKTWATSYDASVAEAMSTTELLITAMGNYATILQQLGYNWAVADYEERGGRPEPVAPTPFAPVWMACQAPPPAADGPGSGLFDDVGFAVDALAQFGVEMPDGDPHKLFTAADAWAKFASEEGAGNLPTLLETLAKSFESETTPELADVDEHLRELKASATAVLDLYTHLSQGCRDHGNAILAFRTQMGQLLVDLAKDLAQEIAETVVFSIVAGALTAGMGAAAVAAAKAGKLAIKLAKYVDRTIEIKLASKFVGKIGGDAEALAARKAKLEEIATLFRNRVDDLAATTRGIGARSANDVKAGLNSRTVPGKNKPNRQMDTDAEIRELYRDLTANAQQETRADGTTFSKLDDGTEISLRDHSSHGGVTIDIKYPNGSTAKVHLP